MKKKWVLVLLVMMCIVLYEKVEASTYQYFEKIEVIGSGKLLSNLQSREIDQYQSYVKKRKFWGWRIHHVHQNIKVKYISETHFSYYNNGYTPIEYTYKLHTENSETFHVTATGSIGINNSKDGKGFKNGLSASLKIETSYKKQSSIEETTTLSFKIDPGTQVNLYTYGEGRVTNGVAANYRFWIRFNLGAFEYFVVTTQYHRLEKVKV